MRLHRLFQQFYIIIILQILSMSTVIWIFLVFIIGCSLACSATASVWQCAWAERGRTILIKRRSSILSRYSPAVCSRHSPSRTIPSYVVLLPRRKVQRCAIRLNKIVCVRFDSISDIPNANLMNDWCVILLTIIIFIKLSWLKKCNRPLTLEFRTTSRVVVLLNRTL